MKHKFTFSGDVITRNHAYGKQFSSEIKALIELYKELWELSFDEVIKRVESLKKAITTHFPGYVQEIEAIAQGAQVPAEHIYALNCRSEFMPPKTLTECTAIGVPQQSNDTQSVLLAQNWDWYPSFLPYTQVVEFDYGTHTTLTLLEPGMLAKLGMNNNGIGVCLNFLETNRVDYSGIPVHIVLRAILDCTTTQEAIDLVKNIPLATAANYLVADKSGHIVSIETTPDEVNIISGGDYVVHTNKFTAKGEACNRLNSFVDALAFGGKELSSEHIKESFKVKGVLQPNEESSPGIETVHSLVMDLTGGTLEVAQGKDVHEYQQFTLE